MASIFFFKQVQAYLQPLTHPNRAGSLWLGWPLGTVELSKGETLRTSPGGSSHARWCLESSRWSCPNHHLFLASTDKSWWIWICSWICTSLCRTIWPTLASVFSPFSLAGGQHTLQQGATVEEGKWGGASSSTGSVLGQGKSPALGVQTQLPSGLLHVVLPTTWDTAAVFYGSLPPGAEELQCKIYPSVIRDKAAHLAAFSFILAIKDLY